MDCSVTIRAKRTQVVDWVYFVFFANAGYGFYVVNMYEPLKFGSIICAKVESANATFVTMMIQAFVASFFVSLVAVYQDRMYFTFN